MRTILTLALAAALAALALARSGDTVNSNCPITGKPVDGTHVVEHAGKEIGVCCNRCKATVAGWDDAKKDAYLAGLDAEAQESSAKEPAEPKVWAGEPYLLTVCPFTGRTLGETAVTKEHEGRTIRVCCGRCAKRVDADPAAVLAKIDTLVADAQRPIYPRTTCCVRGEPLVDEEGNDVAEEVVVKGRLFRVCCQGCVKKVREEPGRYAAQLDEDAKKAQAADYPLDHCLVMTDHVFEADEEPTEIVVGGRLLRLCCKRCARKVAADPAKYVAAVDAARAEKSK